MRILLFTENDHAGGMDTCIATLIEQWPDKDQFFLMCNNNHPGLLELAARLGTRCSIIQYNIVTREKVMAWCAERSRALVKVVRAFLSATQYILFVFQVLVVRSMIVRVQPDRVLIVAGSYPGGSMPRAAALYGLFDRKRKPVFVYHNDPSPIRWFLFIPEYCIDWLIEKSVAALVTVSNTTQEKLARRPILAKSDKRHVIYNGIAFAKDPKPRGNTVTGIRGELGIASDAPLLLMLGTYEPRKGHAFLFDVFGRVLRDIPNAHLVVAGYGYPYDRARIEGLVQQHHLQSSVHLFGFRKDIIALLDETDVLVVPSQHSESFGLTIVEAMARKVPVVATRVGGMPEVLREGEGGYTVPINVELFAEAVIHIVQNPALRRSLADAGYAAAHARFDARRMVKEYAVLLGHE